jgi:uncharacterized membrane protein
MVLSGIVAALFTLPDARIAVHWSASGEADVFAGRWVALLGAPTLLAVLWMALQLWPRRQVESRQAPAEPARSPAPDMVWLTGLVLLILLQAFLISSAFGFQTNRLRLMPIVLGVIMTLVGARMPFLQPNRWFGIRTPWTLGDRDVWTRTHRFGGLVFPAAGMLTASLPLFGLSDDRVGPAVLVILLTAALACVAYSWWISRRLNGQR